uniref:Uncharacterized protein n=1 Tax=Ditylenchus dipsaci TaxID=166011 RepID=A0A915EBS9_9BILA
MALTGALSLSRISIYFVCVIIIMQSCSCKITGMDHPAQPFLPSNPELRHDQLVRRTIELNDVFESARSHGKQRREAKSPDSSGTIDPDDGVISHMRYGRRKRK